jgi:hypothetical protein
VRAHYSLWTSVLLDASSALLHIFWVHFVHGTSTRAGAQGTSTHFSCAGFFWNPMWDSLEIQPGDHWTQVRKLMPCGHLWPMGDERWSKPCIPQSFSARQCRY